MMMRAIFLLALLVVAGISLPNDAYGGWGAGGCSSGSCSLAGRSASMFQVPVFQASRPVVSDGWHEGHMADGSLCHEWYQGGVRYVGYDPARQIYRTYDRATNAWSAPQVPPWKRVKQCACGGDYHRCDCDPKACACPGCTPAVAP